MTNYIVKENNGVKISEAKNYKILETSSSKLLDSDNYKFIIENHGEIQRFGSTRYKEPKFNPFGPEVIDWEITSTCYGPAGKPCVFCFKSNTPKGKNMSFETFKDIFHKLPKTVSKIIFSADGDLSANPDQWKMFDYCRNNDYNKVDLTLTVANISKETAIECAKYTSIVAVSRYENKNWCYDSVKNLVDAGIHPSISFIVSGETYDLIYETINDYHQAATFGLGDSRLIGISSMNFCFLKETGRGINYTVLSNQHFRFLMEKFSREISLGRFYDRCSTGILMEINDIDDIHKASCDVGLFSCYIDVGGNFNFCSYVVEKHKKFFQPINLLNINDFEADVWMHPAVVNFRNEVLRRNELIIPCSALYDT